MKKNTPHDAMGQRISKTVTNKNTTDGTDKFVTTYYVRDPQGNVLAVYEHKRGESGNGTFTLTEQHLYGASRLGMTKPNLVLSGTGTNSADPTAPSAHYELTNHLGNVLSVITPDASDATQPAIESLTDYYPFGMEELGRSYTSNDYRFGYTGHEKECDVAEGVYTTQYRLLDTRLGRWMSVDMLAMHYSNETPYLYCGGNPMMFFDLDGREKLVGVDMNFPTRAELDALGTKAKQQKLIDHRIGNVTIDATARYYPRNIGVIHLWNHGFSGGGGMRFYDCVNHKNIDMKNAVKVHEFLLEYSEIYKRNNPDGGPSKCSILVLHACQTGMEGGIGQQVSEELNLLVVAPSMNVEVNGMSYHDHHWEYVEFVGSLELQHRAEYDAHTRQIPRGGFGWNDYDIIEEGEWNIYYKGELMESFNAKTKPLFNDPQKTIITVR